MAFFYSEMEILHRFYISIDSQKSECYYIKQKKALCFTII